MDCVDGAALCAILLLHCRFCTVDLDGVDATIMKTFMIMKSELDGIYARSL